MYETSEGFRVLLGNERDLFCFAALELAEMIYRIGNDVDPGDDNIYTGIDSFDQLTTLQKLNMINLASKVLLDENYPSPPRTAILDATIAAIYDSLKIELDIESNFRESKLINILNKACVLYPKNYERKIEELKDRILLDHDWELAGLQDENPVLAKMHKLQLGIENDYFTAIAPDSGSATSIYEEIFTRCGGSYDY